MVLVLDEAPSFGSQLGRSLGQGLGSAVAGGAEGFANKINRKKEDEFLEKEYGIKLSGITDPQTRREFIQSAMASQAQGEKLRAARQEKEAPARQGLDTIARQRERLASGHLGPKLGGIGQTPKIMSSLSNEGRKVRSGYEQAGKELIQLASTLPIRNKAEFEVLAERLYDPTLPEAAIEGILDEMEFHLKGALEGRELEDVYKEYSSGKQSTKPQKPKRSLSSFMGK